VVKAADNSSVPYFSRGVFGWVGGFCAIVLVVGGHAALLGVLFLGIPWVRALRREWPPAFGSEFAICNKVIFF
jgi:hypothetical protein